MAILVIDKALKELSAVSADRAVILEAGGGPRSGPGAMADLTPDLTDRFVASRDVLPVAAVKKCRKAAYPAAAPRSRSREVHQHDPPLATCERGRVAAPAPKSRVSDPSSKSGDHVPHPGLPVDEDEHIPASATAGSDISAPGPPSRQVPTATAEQLVVAHADRGRISAPGGWPAIVSFAHAAEHRVPANDRRSSGRRPPRGHDVVRRCRPPEHDVPPATRRSSRHHRRRPGQGVPPEPAIEHVAGRPSPFQCIVARAARRRLSSPIAAETG